MLVEVRGVHPFHMLVIQIVFETHSRRRLLRKYIHIAEGPGVRAAAHALVEDRVGVQRLVEEHRVPRRAHGQVLVGITVKFRLAARRMD